MAVDRYTKDDFKEFTRWTVDLEEVRKLFPGYIIFTQMEAHIFLSERPDMYYKGDSKQYWNDRIKEMRRKEVSN
jgi:hypothetical protein